MPDSKITALASIGTGTDPVNDALVIVDVSDVSPGGMSATGTTKRVSLNNLLASSPTATLASATITGDLTVDTSTLKVDSTNNRVGINTASPQTTLDSAGTVTISGGTGAARRLNFDASGVYLNYIESAGTAGAGYMVFAAGNSEVYRIATGGTSTWSVGGSTAMTLNSTGLGVGTSPSRKLSVSGAGGGLDVTDTTQSTRIRMRSGSASDFFVEAVNSAESAYITLRLNGNTQIDSSGNVGIGITPKPWRSGARALQLGANGYVSLHEQSNGNANLCFAAYEGSANVFNYTTTGDLPSRYVLVSGTHQWYTAPSGTAGNAITFTQAMTLDASGNLLVAKTASGFTVAGAEIRSNGEVLQTIAASTDATIVSKVYSSTAAAYRFYVGLGGTVFATNTTISAISDARLKENVQDIDVGLGAILALKPRKFDWKEGKGKNIKGDRGFIAQEFEQVFPQLVDKWADESPEGEAPYKSVRQDLIPVLVKAIQELTARVQTLETR